MRFLSKLFFFLFIFLLTSGITSYAEVLKKVTVTGNERITLETIAIFGDIKLGEDYPIPIVNHAEQKTKAIALFKDFK